MSATRGQIDPRTRKLIDKYKQILQKFVAQSGAPTPNQVLAQLLKEYIGSGTSSKLFKAHTRTHVEFASNLLAKLSDPNTTQGKIEKYLDKERLKQSGDFFALLSVYFNYYKSAYPSLGQNIVEQIITPNEERLHEQQHAELFTRLKNIDLSTPECWRALDVLRYTSIPNNKLNDLFEVVSHCVKFRSKNCFLYSRSGDPDLMNMRDTLVEIFAQIYLSADATLKKQVLTFLLPNAGDYDIPTDIAFAILSKLALDPDPVFKEVVCASNLDNMRPRFRLHMYRVLHLSGNLESNEKQAKAVADLISLCESYEDWMLSNAFATLSTISKPDNKYAELVSNAIMNNPLYASPYKNLIHNLTPHNKAMLRQDMITYLDDRILNTTFFSFGGYPYIASAYKTAKEIGIPPETETKWLEKILADMNLKFPDKAIRASQKLREMGVDIPAYQGLQNKLIKYVGESIVVNPNDKKRIYARTQICIALCESKVPDTCRESQIDKLISLLKIKTIKNEEYDPYDFYRFAVRDACCALGRMNIPEKKLPHVIDALLSVINNTSGNDDGRLLEPARNSLLALVEKMSVSQRIATMVKLDAMTDYDMDAAFSITGFREKFKEVVTQQNMTSVLRATGIRDDDVMRPSISS